MRTTTDFPAVLAALMAEAGVSALGVADRTGLTHQAVLDLAAGRVAGPRATSVERILQAFGKPWAYLDGFQVPAPRRPRAARGRKG